MLQLHKQYSATLLSVIVMMFLFCKELNTANPYDPLAIPEPLYPARYPIDIFNAPYMDRGDIVEWCIRDISTDNIISRKEIGTTLPEIWDKNGFVPTSVEHAIRIRYNVNKIGPVHVFGGISVRLLDIWDTPFNLARLDMEYLTFKVKATADVNMGIALQAAGEKGPLNTVETCPKRLLWYEANLNRFSWKPDMMKGSEYRMDTTWQEVRIPVNDLLYHLVRDEQNKKVTIKNRLDISRLMYITFAFGFDEFSNNGGAIEGIIYLTDIAFERGESRYSYPRLNNYLYTPPPSAGMLYLVIDRDANQTGLFLYLQNNGVTLYRGVLDAATHSGATVLLPNSNNAHSRILRIVTDGSVMVHDTVRPPHYENVNYQILNLEGAGH